MALLLNLMIIQLSAQDLNLLEFSYSNYPSTDIPESPFSETASIQEYQVAIRVPMVLKDNKWILLHSGVYGIVLPDVEPNTVAEDQNLHFIGYSLTVIKPLNEKRQLLAVMQPAISSQLDQKLSRDDFLCLGSLALSTTVNEKTRWMAGIAFISRFGRPLVIPLFGYDKKWSRSKLSILFPNKAEWYWISKDEAWEIGPKMVLNGSQFNLATGTRTPYDNVQFSRVNLGLSINRALGKSGLFLNAFTGIAAGRTYDIISETLPDIDFSSDPGPVISFGLFFRPSFGE